MASPPGLDHNSSCDQLRHALPRLCASDMALDPDSCLHFSVIVLKRQQWLDLLGVGHPSEGFADSTDPDGLWQMYKVWHFNHMPCCPGQCVHGIGV